MFLCYTPADGIAIVQAGRSIVSQQRVEGIPAESQPMATVRAVHRAHGGRRRRDTELRVAFGHVLQALASGGHAKTVDQLFRRVRHPRLGQFLRGQTVAHQHQGVHNRAGLRRQRLDRLGGHAGRMRQRRRKGTTIMLSDCPSREPPSRDYTFGRVLLEREEFISVIFPTISQTANVLRERMICTSMRLNLVVTY